MKRTLAQERKARLCPEVEIKIVPSFVFSSFPGHSTLYCSFLSPRPCTYTAERRKWSGFELRKVRLYSQCFKNSKPLLSPHAQVLLSKTYRGGNDDEVRVRRYLLVLIIISPRRPINKINSILLSQRLHIQLRLISPYSISSLLSRRSTHNSNTSL